MKTFSLSFLKLLLLLLLTVRINHTLAQKPPLEIDILDKWPAANGALISDDGKYVVETVNNIPRGYHSLEIVSTNSNYKFDIISKENSFNPVLTNNGKILIFNKTLDSVGINILGDSNINYLNNVQSFKLPQVKNNKWIGYNLNNPNKNFILLNLTTKYKKIFANVSNYFFSPDGDYLILVKNLEDGLNEDSSILELLNLNDLISRKIFQGPKQSSIIFSKDHKFLAFTTSVEISNNIEKTVWIYNFNEGKMNSFLNKNISQTSTNLRIADIIDFSKDDNNLFLTLEEFEPMKSIKEMVKLNVWSYTDEVLQSIQLNELSPNRYLAVISLKKNTIIKLQNTHEQIIQFNPKDLSNYILVVSRKGSLAESNWNIASQSSVFLVSVQDGSRMALSKNKNLLGVNYEISPDDRYVIYSDSTHNNYFSYEISTGRTQKIIQDSVNRFDLAAWGTNDREIIFYDEFDIWVVDPLGRRPPIAITSGFGRQHNITLRMTNTESRSIIDLAATDLLLIAFNKENKENGFYLRKKNRNENPIKLTMGSYCYFTASAAPIGKLSKGILPIKAKSKNIYLVGRSSATESFNYFVTTDFKKYKRISNLYPEKEYNWLTTELHEWKLPNGSFSQGILYKPENFDSTKIYPLIFFYYETLSDRLNCYIPPQLSDGNLNISWYVSNGYLVFTPDIHAKKGESGKGALDCVVSAAKYLSSFSFVDKEHMGIQGLSHGGFETNYIVTHTNIFAAAVSASGATNLISKYGMLRGGGDVSQSYYEIGQGYMGATLWEKPDIYIQNSPVLFADRISTPILLMGTTIDDAVPFSQAVEFFTALRRLGKKAWLLEYNSENHGLSGVSAKDFTIRMSQFYNHYLLKKPASKWMTQGIPAKRKGIDLGLDIDTSIQTPGAGLLKISVPSRIPPGSSKMN